MLPARREGIGMLIESILIVGCGNMGGAMLSGWLASGMDPTRFTVVDPFLPSAPDGVTLLRDVPDRKFGAVLLGVKPQILGDAAAAVGKAVNHESIILSILAGIKLETLSTFFPEVGAIVRIMPNLAAAIGRSPVALAATGLDQAGRDAVTALMRPLGTPEWLTSEDLFDAVTALAGSGPAFLYRFIDALALGAAGLGMDAGQALRLALATVEGASLLAAGSDCSPGELARRVASPGGTTQAGLDVLDADGALARLVGATLKAAASRSAEMGRS